MIEYFDDKQVAWIRQIETSQGRTEDEAISAFRRYLQTHREIPEPAQLPGRFEVFSTITLAHPSRLYPSACCPDKDLFIIVSRCGNKDRVALWKFQGSKKWEVEVARASSIGEVVSVAWNPNGRNIMIAHHPPKLTLHSLESGKEIHTIPLSLQPTVKLSNLWWLEIPEAHEVDEPFPDILKRRGYDPGSVHSLLSQLPSLDLEPDDPCSPRAPEVFIAANASRRRVSMLMAGSQGEFEKWPTLLENFLASRSSMNYAKGTGGESEFDAIQPPSTMLIAADTNGKVHFFFDGTFPLGHVQLAPASSPAGWFMAGKNSHYLTHCSHPAQSSPSIPAPTYLCPSGISLPLLDGNEFYFVARTSSALRHLLWHCRKIVFELRNLWLGSENSEGAANLGPKWLKGIELIQRDNWGYHERRGILELTMLLVTGQASQPLSSILAGGESTSDRKLSRWESTVTEALIKIRDNVEKRLHPALQRAYILLDELKCCATIPGRFTGYNFPVTEIETTLSQVEASIYLSTWLVTLAREELSQFGNFAQWLRREADMIQGVSDAQTLLIPKHDPIEVYKYLMSGLAKSEIDSWFEGAPPDERLLELFRGKLGSLSSVMLDVEKFLKVPGSSPGQGTVSKSIAFRRNLVTLIDSIIVKCSTYFHSAAQAVASTADCTLPASASISEARLEISRFVFKSSLARDLSSPEPCPLKENFVAYVPSDTGANLLCIFQLTFQTGVSSQPVSRVLVSMNACVPKFMDAELHQYKILDFAILDDEHLVVVMRHLSRHSEGTRPFLALVPWRDSCMKYEELRVASSITTLSTREEVVSLAIRLVKETQLAVKPLPLKRVHELSTLGKTGSVTLSCNGKRKVACVLDDNGVVESLDLSTEPEEFDFETITDDDEEEEDRALEGDGNVSGSQ